MLESKKLSYTAVKKECNPDLLGFNNTSELTPLDNIIGQERATKAMEFGFKINARGYNIFVVGATGTGKTGYAEWCAKKSAKDLKIPDDLCYVYNFENPSEPISLRFTAKLGKEFKKDMENLIEILQNEMPEAFDSEDHEKEKGLILKMYNDKRNDLLETLSKDAEKSGFKVKAASTGVYFLPILNGKTVTEQEYGDLDEDIKRELTKKSDAIQSETTEIIRKIKDIDREANEKVQEWENRVALFSVGMYINDMRKKYSDNPKVLKYLEDVQSDILNNLEDFKNEEYCDDQQQLLIPWIKRSEDDIFSKYRVNLMTDNSMATEAPVVVDFNPTYYNLVGKIEYENEFGAMTTDFTMIRQGLFHKANGGYLILQAKDVLGNVQSWEVLKRVLRMKKVEMENIKEQMGLIGLSTLRPQLIEVDVKVILVGSEYIYNLLYAYDEDFKKLFKIKVDFDEEMERNDENIMKLSQFIAAYCQREKTIDFHNTAVGKIIEYSSRLVEHQNKMSTRLNEIVEILNESCEWAKEAQDNMVTAAHVCKAIKEKVSRLNKYDKKILEMLEENTIIINTDGEEIGQINGLSILDMGDYSFGKPSKITANTFIGENGIVNIEREADMSGMSHTKGVLILSGYIGQKYAQNMPLSLSASLCFEQLYGGIDGDSASSAELYAILSSLAELSVKQYIGVTGSVNQKGEIQPIGGATEKIEGFFELCKLRGLNGKHGVIIPEQNVKNLVLSDELVESIRYGKFNIYAIRTIDEGIEILTGVKAGVKDEQGEYPEGTVNDLVYKKLKKFAETVNNFGHEKQHSED